LRHGGIEQLLPGESWDFVFLLNVIHHIDDPVSFLRELLGHCSHKAIIEFPLAHDPAVLSGLCGAQQGVRVGLPVALKMRFASFLVKFLSSFLPITLLGDRPYHRRWHLSARAFEVIGSQMIEGVDRIEIRKSTWNRYRALAILTMK